MKTELDWLQFEGVAFDFSGTLEGQGSEAMPGAIEFVQRAAERLQDKMMIVTSAHLGEVLSFLEHYKLLRYFPNEHIVSIETILARGLMPKPSPDPYLLAAEILDIKDPPRLLVIEDSLSGVAAALDAGASCLAVSAVTPREQFYNQPPAHHPDMFVTSLTDLL